MIHHNNCDTNLSFLTLLSGFNSISAGTCICHLFYTRGHASCLSKLSQWLRCDKC